MRGIFAGCYASDRAASSNTTNRIDKTPALFIAHTCVIYHTGRLYRKLRFTTEGGRDSVTLLVESVADGWFVFIAS